MRSCIWSWFRYYTYCLEKFWSVRWNGWMMPIDKLKAETDNIILKNSLRWQNIKSYIVRLTRWSIIWISWRLKVTKRKFQDRRWNYGIFNYRSDLIFCWIHLIWSLHCHSGKKIRWSKKRWFIYPITFDIFSEMRKNWKFFQKN